MSSLLDYKVVPQVVRITEAVGEQPAVDISVFGLTTEDLMVLAETNGKVLAAIFLGNLKEGKEGVESSKEIMREFPAFGAQCIACACKQPDLVEHVRNFPVLIQVELLAAVMEKTLPGDNLKKSLLKLAPTIARLLKK